ncbi:MAG: transporter substrate-binding domain-containing protein [Ignavibacteriaceae bacterium]|nr:transporter substrate-binding domain-containing protein [Ignavibacteriaceae bacterium]
MKTLIIILVIILFNGGIPIKLFASDSIMTYIYNAPESALDKRYIYHWDILRTALEKTKQKYGNYRMIPSEVMTEKRQAYELENATGKLTIMCLGSTPDLEKRLHPIRIPVDKNLNGYELFLIRKEDKDRFKNIKTLDDLKKYTFGLGFGWIDTDILRANGIKVVTASNYDGLFEMLINKRFDIALRSAGEILWEEETRKDKLPDLMIEENILIYYPLPMYFWFSKTEDGRRLSTRVEEGMKMMINDGTFDEIFAKYENNKIAKLNLKNRRIIKLENPFMDPNTPIKEKKLWFDPKNYILPIKAK